MDPRNQPISESYSIIKTTKSEFPKDEYYHHSVKYTDDRPGKSNSNKKSKKHPKQEIEYVQKTPRKRKYKKNKGNKNLYDDEESHGSKKAGNYIRPGEYGYGYGDKSYDTWDDDEGYGDKRHEDGWHGDKRHEDGWYGDKRHRDEGHGGDWYGGRRYGDKWHGDRRYKGKRYGDTLYGDRWHGDTRYGDSHDLEKYYEGEIGKKHISDHKATAGEDVSKGYKKEEGYDELQNDKHANEHKESEVSLNKGSKKGHVDQLKSRGEDYKGKEGEKGISIVKKGGHKKGKKTSGFHKVHKKDEYKKDIVFYDEAHDGGEHEEHEHEQEQHKEEEGAHGIKGHVDSAYNEEQVHKEGAKKKGEQFEEAEGHKREGGHEEHHDHQSEYDKEAKLKEGGKYGHLEGGVVEEGYSEEEEY